jgi:hypothetical protein
VANYWRIACTVVTIVCFDLFPRSEKICPRQRECGLAILKKFPIMLLLAAFACGTKYKSGDPVIAFSDLIGPSDNPIETFPYLSLPFCTAPTLATAHKSLGDILLGHALADVGLHFSFLQSKDKSPLCAQTLTTDGSAALAKAVSQRCWARFIVDDFPVGIPSATAIASAHRGISRSATLATLSST